MKILVTYDMFREGFTELESKYEVTFPEGRDFTYEEVFEMIPEYDVLCSMFDFPVNKELIDHASKLRLIANYAVGYNNIDVAYALEKGQMSRPFESPAGWHIILMKDRRMCMPYDTLRASILQFVERRGMVEAIINQRIDSIARQQGSKVSHEEVLTARMKELEAKQPELRYLIQEYHDGLLLFEMSNRTVWEKAQNDKEGQENYFKANRKRYKWTEPHYKGIAYHTRTQADIAAVKKAVKGLPFDKWAERLRTTFNNDSILRIRVEKGIFVKGDNKTIDRLVFKTGDEAKPNKDFPFDAVYGKKLKAPNEAADVNALVVADYQEYLEEKWVGELRKRYTFTVNEDVVNTVNKH